MKDYFPEIKKAELEVKKVLLESIEIKNKEVQPFMDALVAEKSSLEHDIERIKEKQED